MSGLEYCSGQKRRRHARPGSRRSRSQPGRLEAAGAAGRLGDDRSTARAEVGQPAVQPRVDDRVADQDQRAGSRCAACMASASPKVPEVVSTITVPGSSSPSAGACRRM